MFISTAPTIYCTCNQSAQDCLFIIFLFLYNNNYIYTFFLHRPLLLLMMLFFSRWILVTSLVGALAVNFLSQNVTLHVQIIVNMLFRLLLLLIYFFILLYKQY